MSDAIEVGGGGLIVGDRRVMLVDAVTGAFISQRHEPKLARLVATLADGRLTLRWGDGGPASVGVTMNGPTRSVTVWDDAIEAIDLGGAIAARLGTLLGRAVRLVRLPDAPARAVDAYWAGPDVATTFADFAPILVTSTASLDDLNARRVSRRPVADRDGAVPPKRRHRRAARLAGRRRRVAARGRLVDHVDQAVRAVQGDRARPADRRRERRRSARLPCRISRDEESAWNARRLFRSKCDAPQHRATAGHAPRRRPVSGWPARMTRAAKT